MSIRTAAIEGGWVVSENHVWVPGVYDTEDTARRAVKYTDAQLQALQDQVNLTHPPPGPCGVITTQMLDTLETA